MDGKLNGNLKRLVCVGASFPNCPPGYFSTTKSCPIMQIWTEITTIPTAEIISDIILIMFLVPNPRQPQRVCFSLLASSGRIHSDQTSITEFYCALWAYVSCHVYLCAIIQKEALNNCKQALQRSLFFDSGEMAVISLTHSRASRLWVWLYKRETCKCLYKSMT